MRRQNKRKAAAINRNRNRNRKTFNEDKFLTRILIIQGILQLCKEIYSMFK